MKKQVKKETMQDNVEAVNAAAQQVEVETKFEDMSHDQLMTAVNKYKALADGLTAENLELMQEIEDKVKLLSKGDEYLSQLVIMKSDFENYRKRTKDNTNDNQENGKMFVIEKILPVLDTFDRAIGMVKDDDSINALQLVKKQFETILAQVGVEEIDVLDKDFDVATAHAINKREVEDKLKNKVLEVYTKGYIFAGQNNSKVIRFAQVCVGC